MYPQTDHYLRLKFKLNQSKWYRLNPRDGKQTKLLPSYLEKNIAIANYNSCSFP